MSTGLLLLAALTSPAGGVDFDTEVVPVLTRAGCNAGSCHGNLNGKGGLKLSLRGQDLAFDYASLTRDMLGRDVWKEPDGVLTNVIEVCVNALRKKVERSGLRQLVHTVRGVGYAVRDR